MKNLFFALIFLLGLQAQSQDVSPYIKVGETTETIQVVSAKVAEALKTNSFSIIGGYHPEGKTSLSVLVFTRTDIKNTVVKVTDRGALAAAFKVGFVRKNGKTVISYTNPEYLLRAYLRENYTIYRSVFEKFSSDVKKALAGIGNDFTPFGGAVSATELKKYHYKIMMPYFTDPITLNEYTSFEEGLKTIEENLKAHKGKTVQVYKIVYKSKKIAVFGVGLKSQEDGEAVFLPKIGENHIAAMPYEIILQGNKVTMLHGKYRIALFWPELTMGTFMKIMSTPGDIEDTLEAVCK
jgi:hypothetical protein